MSKTATDHDAIREHALEVCGCVDAKRCSPLSVLRQTEWGEDIQRFVEMMRNRRIMGAFRYGMEEEPGKYNFDLVAGLQRKVDEYVRTGNSECLIDAANYCHMEFNHPTHPNAHFAPCDDKNHCPASTGD